MPYKDKEKQKEYQREWYEKRRREWILANGPCTKCGSWDNLEVDHKNPEEKLCSPKHIWSRSDEFRELELKKCQVLCEECHRNKTNGELSRDVIHGTYSGYTHYKCRCELCRRAKSIYAKNLRENKKVT